MPAELQVTKANDVQPFGGGGFCCRIQGSWLTAQSIRPGRWRWPETRWKNQNLQEEQHLFANARLNYNRRSQCYLHLFPQQRWHKIPQETSLSTVYSPVLLIRHARDAAPLHEAIGQCHSEVCLKDEIFATRSTAPCRGGESSVKAMH